MLDFDFALILVIVTGVCFVLWLVDKLLFAGKRNAAIAGLRKRFAEFDDPASSDHKHYQLALETEAHQPAIFEYASSFLPVFAVVLVLRSFLFEPFQIPSASMVPTLQVGDFILVNKYTYGLRLPVTGTKIVDISEPARGDVMVFFPPHDSRYFIKRVIGLPGDRVEVRNKLVFVNGEEASQQVQQEFLAADPPYRLIQEDLGGVEHDIRLDLRYSRALTPMQIYPNDFSLTVKEGHYFMMGDNRDHSSDSRFWGLVPEKNIVGKAFFIWMHWNEFLSIPGFDRFGSIE